MIRHIFAFGIALTTFMWVMVCAVAGSMAAMSAWPDAVPVIAYATLAVIFATLGTAFGMIAYRGLWHGFSRGPIERRGFDVLPPQ